MRDTEHKVREHLGKLIMYETFSVGVSDNLCAHLDTNFHLYLEGYLFVYLDVLEDSITKSANRNLWNVGWL